MPLLRGFSKVDSIRNPVSNGVNEAGVIAIPSNIREQVGLFPGSSVSIKIVKIKDSARWPYIIIHNPEVLPRLSMLQVIMMEGTAELDNEDRLILADNILREIKLESGNRVEIKLVGPKGASWAVIYNRGPNRLTTLQEKMGRLRKNGGGAKKWQIQKWEY
ncbi:MAG: hypothetical protein KJ706_06650 [Candidatus Omnitrophica bacterium]|nr:hypothetical protein [Candidatus Omnitrophota bacterium]